MYDMGYGHRVENVDTIKFCFIGPLPYLFDLNSPLCVVVWVVWSGSVCVRLPSQAAPRHVAAPAPAGHLLLPPGHLLGPGGGAPRPGAAVDCHREAKGGLHQPG